LERQQFSYFLNVLQLVHAPSHIESRSKPEPDICFQNKVAFELTEICPLEVAHANIKFRRIWYLGGSIKVLHNPEKLIGL
jgi:hypothetical protein